jgi:hypothetical protein
MGSDDGSSTYTGAFADFSPGESDHAVDVVAEHDRFGIEWPFFCQWV